MEGQASTIFSLCIGLLLADFYITNGLRQGLKNWRFVQKDSFLIGYWVVSGLLVAGLIASVYLKFNVGFKGAVLLLFFFDTVL